MECPAGMVYQQCGSLCVQTCDNINDDSICEGGCAEGCFCPDGEVLFEGECVQPARCTGRSDNTLYTYIDTCTHVKLMLEYMEINVYRKTFVVIASFNKMPIRIISRLKSFAVHGVKYWENSKSPPRMLC